MPTPRNSLRAELVGCYAFSLRETPLRNYAQYVNASWLVRLDSTPLSGFSISGRVPRVLTRLDASPSSHDDSPFGPSWWADSLSDTLRISFSDGLTGAGLVFVVPRSMPVDSFTGFIKNYWDSGPPWGTDSAFVLATRKPCRAP